MDRKKMKYLKKYNESVDNSEVSDYIKLVFSDFIDDGSEFEFDEGVSDAKFGSGLPFAECSININLPTIHKSNKKMDGYSIGVASGSIEYFLKNTNEILEIYKDVETCINRIKDKYPDIRYKIDKESDEIYRDKILSYITIFIEWGEHSNSL